MYADNRSQKNRAQRIKKMKRYLLAASLLLLPLGVFHATGANAGLNVSIGINLPLTGVVVSSEPDVAVISGTYVYFIPDAQEDIFFFHGYWYRPYGGRWYRSTHYNRGWVFISINNLPGPVRHVPRDFRHVPPGLAKIPYGQMKKNWRTWEKERHWEREGKRERVSERREHHEHGRHNGWREGRHER